MVLEKLPSKSPALLGSNYLYRFGNAKNKLFRYC